MSDKPNKATEASAKTSGPGRLKLPVEELRMGMYVSALDRPWLESPFAFQGFVLNTEADLQAVRDLCVWVMVDIQRSRPGVFRRPSSTGHVPDRKPASSELRRAGGKRAPGVLSRMLSRLSRRKEPASPATDVIKGVENVRDSFDHTSKLVRTIMDDVRLGKSIDTPAAKQAVSECVDRIIHNPEAMVLLSNIKNKDAYTSEHSMNVAILSIVLGRKLGMPRHELEELGLSGMLHDVGKVLTPIEILNKPGRLTVEEMLIMKMHPTQGRDVLLSSDGIASAALDVAHGHHERLDGSGYPRGITEQNTTLFTKIVSVTDTFDAITSDRVYGHGRTTIEAFKILQACGGNRYRSDLVNEFIDAIGVYPPGSVVQLTNGQIGVVVQGNPKYKLRPKVLVVKQNAQEPVTPHYVDLAEPHDNDKGRLSISRMLRAQDVGIDTHLFRERRFLAALGE